MCFWEYFSECMWAARGRKKSAGVRLPGASLWSSADFRFRKRPLYLCAVMGGIAFFGLALPQQAYAATVTVKSDYELGLALAQANSGDTVLLEAGSYYGGDDFHVSAIPSNPVTVAPVERGTVYFRGTFTFLGRGLVLDGIDFRDGGELVFGTGDGGVDAESMRVTNCTFDNLSTARWLQVKEGARKITIDHNAFTNKNTKGQLLQIRPSASAGINHVVRNNYFANIAYGGGENQYETIQVGQNGITDRNIQTRVLIEQNLFERADGEGELISIKTSGNEVRYNTFRKSRGALVFRHGHDNRAEGNFFFGEGVSSTGGIRFQGDNNVIINNYFEDIIGSGARSSITIMDGVDPMCFEVPSNSCYCEREDAVCYDIVEGVLIAFNSFVNSSAVRVGHNHSSGSNKYSPRDVVFANNVFYRTGESGYFMEIVETPNFHGDELTDPVFEGNIFFGGEGLCTGVTAYCPEENVGFEKIDPWLVRLVAGLYGPSEYSPLIDAAMTSGPAIDALGRERVGIADVGAIEGVSDWSPYPPLTRDDVGPYNSPSPLPPEPLPPGPSPTDNLAWLVPVTNLILL